MKLFKKDKMTGVHYIVELQNCQDSLLYNVKINDYLVNTIIKHGLNVCNYFFHKFSNSSYSGAIILEESHFTIHTWPETKTVYYDLYVCNYSKDNTKDAQKIVESINNYFNPSKIKIQKVNR